MTQKYGFGHSDSEGNFHPAWTTSDEDLQSIFQNTPGSIDDKLAAMAAAGPGYVGAAQWLAASGLVDPSVVQNSGIGRVASQAQADSESKSFGNFASPLIKGGILAGGAILGGAAMGLGGAGAAGAAMPAAIPETAAALAEMGLVEVSPGVWAAGGAGVGGAVGAGAAAGAGASAAPAPLADAGMDLGMYGDFGNPYVLGSAAPGMTQATMAAAAGGGSVGTTAAATAAGAASGTALSRMLSGKATLEDYLGIAGNLGVAGLGYLGAGKQADAYQAAADQYMAIGAPSRDRYEASYAPGFSMANEPGYKDALDLTTKSFLHKASIAGNPADSPNAWMQTLKDVNSTFAYPALQNYRSMNANAGGLSRFADAAPGATSSAINADAGKLNAIGYAAGNIFNPPTNLEQLLKAMR